MPIVNTNIGQALVKEKFLTEEQLVSAYDHQLVNKTSLKQSIIDLKVMTEDQVNAAIIDCSDSPFIRLQDYQIEQDAISKIPESKCRQYNLVPISLVDNLLTVAISDPFDLVALDDIALISNCEIIPMLSDEKEIINVIEHYYSKERIIQNTLPAPSVNIENISKNILTVDEIHIATEPVSREKPTKIDETSVIVIINQIISSAIRKHASDIHIEPRDKVIGLRYRIDGVLVEQDTLPRSIQSTLISRIKTMSKMDIGEHQLPQDGRVRIVFEGREVDLKVCSLPLRYGEKIVIRILDDTSFNINMDKLSFNPGHLSGIKKALELPQGMILVTGPTGSGKTTTLYAALNHINSPELNIITVEDPIEYEIPMINQVQIHPACGEARPYGRQESGLTFPTALKFILRQDPDVIMLSEIRDRETLNIAMQSALTGHRVFSTLNTNDAASAVTRLLDMGGEPYLISSSLQLVIAQRLMKRLCENCKESQPVTAQIASLFKEDGFKEIPSHIFKPRGCSRCLKSGYMGRIAAIELLVISDKIRELIVKSTSATAIRQKAIEEGMIPIRYDALSKVAAGITSLEQALKETI